MSARLQSETTGNIHLDDLRPYLGACCFILSCYEEFPNCIGCISKLTILCTSCHLSICKPSRDPISCFMCFSLGVELVKLESLIQSRSQFFCQDWRIAVPSSSEVPCMINFCFLTCYYKDHFTCKCCSRVHQLEDNPQTMKYDPKSDGESKDGVEMIEK